MAKKDEFGFDEIELDDLNFGDFGEFDDGGKPPSKSREAINSFKSSAKNTVADRLTDKGLVRRLISMTLGKGYAQAFNTYDAINKAADDIFKSNAGSLDPYMRDFKRRYDKASPLVKRLYPKSMRDAMDRSEGRGPQYQAEDELGGQIGGIDALLGFNAKQKMDGEIRDAIKEDQGRKRFKVEMGARMEVAQGIGRLVGFQDTVLINYYRKQLELSYRHLDISTRMLRGQERFHSDARELLKNVMTNTSLPDFIKMRGPEVIKMQLQQRLSASLLNSAGNWTSDYFGKIKKNADDVLGGFLQARELTSDMGLSRATMAGAGIGQAAGSAVSSGLEMLLEELATRVAPLAQKIPGVSNLNKKLRGGLVDLPQRLNEYAKSSTKRRFENPLMGSLVENAEEALKAVMDRYAANTTIHGGGVVSLDEGAAFDNNVYKTWTEIIPAALFAIERNTRAALTGNMDEEELGWSHYKDGLATRSDINREHLTLSLKQGSGNNIRSNVDALLRQMGADQLSADAKKALRRRLMKDMMNADRFKPDRYIKHDVWSELPEEIANELINFFADTFGLDIEGKETGTGRLDEDKQLDIREEFSSLTKLLPGYNDRMNLLSKVVGRRSWRELGLSSYNGAGSDTINQDALYDLLLRSEDAGDEDGFDPQGDAPRGQGPRRARPAPRPSPGPAEYSDDNSRARRDPEQPVIDWAEHVFNLKDDGTHQRLDALTEVSMTAAQLLEAILSQGIRTYDAGPAEEMGEGGEGSSPRSRLRFGEGLNLRSLTKFGLKTTGKVAKGLGRYFKFSYGLMGKGIGGAFSLGRGIVGGAFKPREGLGITDIYVQGDSEPVMTASKIRRGFYFDVNTKKVIKKLRDITGQVKDRDGNIVLTEEDFETGLMAGDGNSIMGYLGRKAVGAGLGIGKGVASYLSFTYGSMWRVLKWGANKLTEQFTQADGYFPGEDVPRIRWNLLKNGFYRNEKGAPLLTYDQINGAVYDRHGNVVISEEEWGQYKSLFKRNGSILFTLGRGTIKAAGALASLGVRALKAYGRFTVKAYKAAWATTKYLASVPSRLMGRYKGKKGAAMGNGDPIAELSSLNLDVSIEQLKTQHEILNILRKQFDSKGVFGDQDGDGVRENSWQDILRRRAGGKAAKGEKGAYSGPNADLLKAIKDLNKNMSGKLDELMDVTEEAGETSLLEDAGDIADISDASRDGKRRGKRPPRGFKSGRGIRGKIGNAARWAVRGAGNLLGRIPGGSALLGRGAMMAGSAYAAGSTALAGTGAALATAGSAAVSAGAAGLGMLGTGLAAVGSGIAAAVSSPFVLAAVAVGGLAYLGYRAYKSSEAKKFPLLYLRMTQYGVSPTDSSRVEQVLKLEHMIAQFTAVSNGGEASIDATRIDPTAVMDLFGAVGQERQENLWRWISQRFRPVYLAHKSAMKKVRNSVDLQSADEGLADGDMESYLRIVDIPGMTDVYNNDEVSPFSGDLDEDADDVASALEMVRSKMKDRKKVDADKPGDMAKLPDGRIVPEDAKMSVAANGGTVQDALDSIEPARPQYVAGRLAITGGFIKDESRKSLNIPTAVRFKAYGLKEMSLLRCRQLDEVEKIYWDKIEYKGNDRAMVASDAEQLERKVMDIFKPANEAQVLEVKRWLRHRFIPVLLQYAISCRRRYNGDARDADRNLAGPLMYEVLEEVSKAETEMSTGKMSVWEVFHSPWPGVDLETMPGSITVYLEGLDKGDNTKVVPVDRIKAQDNYDPKNKDYQNYLQNLSRGGTKTERGTLGSGSDILKNMGAIYNKGAVPGGLAGQSTTGQGDGSMLMNNASMGQAVQHPGGGTGGDINDIPEPTGDGWEGTKATIIAAAKMVGFDPEIMASVIGAESAFKIKAGAGTSSAKGLGQFIDGTWSAMMNKYAAKYGINPSAHQFDARANAVMTALFLKENYETLAKSLNGKVTDTDLYAAHFLGPAGAKRFLAAPRNAPSGEHVGENVPRANRSIFYDKSGRMRNVGEVYAELNRRVEIGRKKHDIKGGFSKSLEEEKQTTASTEAMSTSSGSGEFTEGATFDDPAADAGVPNAGAAPAAAAAESAAGGGGGMAPREALPADVAASVSDVYKTPDSGQVDVPMNTTSASISQRQQSSAAQAEAVQAQVAPILEKQLGALTSMDGTLKEIREQLRAMAARQGQGGATPPAQTPTSNLSPTGIKKSLDTTRKNAVT